MILKALMYVATSTYNFFVGQGNGIIYILIWGFLAMYMGLYLVKLFLPKLWLGFIGYGDDGGQAYDGNLGGMKIGEELLKPALRAIIAATILLQIKPTYVTEWIVNPFLEFGAIYTENIIDATNTSSIQQVTCSDDIDSENWLSQDSCNFLVRPVAQITHENNKIIKRGLEFITDGLGGLMTLIPHGGENFMNLVTGILLVTAFFSSNFFMAMLIIQGIFNFGMALILYPFKVLTYVAKKSDDWINPWPAFDGIVPALRQLIITMIACAFIMTVNIAIIKSLFLWNSSIFVVAAGGSASSNLPAANAPVIGFGQHSILWISTILTFYLMFKIFELTKQQLQTYAGSGMDAMHGSVKKDFSTTKSNITKLIQSMRKKE